MAEETSNILFMAVLPVIHMGDNNFGTTEQILTLFPHRSFATEFFPDEADGFIQMFKNRTKYLVGGHVLGYNFEKFSTQDGRVIVKVTQNVG